MRRRITWRFAAAISMLGLAPGIGAAFAVPAGASTGACAAALGGQCGTFTASAYNAHPRGGASGGLGWDVKGQSSASNTPLIEYPNYTPGTDPGTDLTKVGHFGPIPGSRSASRGHWYSVVYTPSGQWTSMCVANPNNQGRGGTNLVLRPCNQQMWQAFMAVSATGNLLPARPTAPHWPTSVVIPNASTSKTGTPYALYSVANGRFVAGSGSAGRALSATGRTGAPLNKRNSWFWTNAIAH